MHSSGDHFVGGMGPFCAVFISYPLAPCCYCCAGLQMSSKQQAEATLSMFKRGGRINTRPAKDGAAGGGGGGGSSRGRKGEQLDAISAKLERKVANCLSCGKIFDCRTVTNDVIRFIGKRRGCVDGGNEVLCLHKNPMALLMSL